MPGPLILLVDDDDSLAMLLSDRPDGRPAEPSITQIRNHLRQCPQRPKVYPGRAPVGFGEA
jgi:hypothetical protein